MPHLNGIGGGYLLRMCRGGMSRISAFATFHPCEGRFNPASLDDIAMNCERLRSNTDQKNSTAKGYV